MNTSTEGFQQCYNAQTAVDEAHQIIVATQVGAQASDQGRLIVGLSDSFGARGGLADAGLQRGGPRGAGGAPSMAMWHWAEGKARVAVAHPCGDASYGRLARQAPSASGCERLGGGWGSDVQPAGLGPANGTWCALR